MNSYLCGGYTKDYISALRSHIDKIVTCYYDEAPASASFPYSVVSGVYVIDLSAGDSMNFYVDVYADENQHDSAVELENLTDKVRNHLSGAVISGENFTSHVGFDNRSNVTENEFDLIHRRLTFTSRIFYI